RVQISSTRVIAIVANATVALDASIHLVIHQWTEILVAERTLVELIAAVIVTGHYGHVLQMTLPPFITHRAIVRMIQHQTLNNGGTEGHRFGIVDSDACALCGGRHAGHHNLSLSIVLVLELLDGALATGADGPERRMPAEIRKIEPRGETPMQQILFRVHPV